MKVQYANQDNLINLSKALNGYLANGWELRGDTVFIRGTGRYFQQIIYRENEQKETKNNTEIKGI